MRTQGDHTKITLVVSCLHGNSKNFTIDPKRTSGIGWKAEEICGECKGVERFTIHEYTADYVPEEMAS